LHRLHEDLALAALDVAEAHAAVDLRDGGRVLRTARLEQLRHARQAARDVARLVRLAADLGDGLAGEYPLAVLRREHRVHRDHEVAYPRLVLSLALPHLDVRMQLLLTILDDDALAQAGELVELLGYRLVLHEVHEANRALHVGDDRIRVRVPGKYDLVLLHVLSVLDHEDGAERHGQSRTDCRTRIVRRTDHQLAFVRGDHSLAIRVRHRNQAIAI